VLHSLGSWLEHVITLSHFFSCKYQIATSSIFTEYSLIVNSVHIDINGFFQTNVF
jgi:hypothetical protein